jgi:hypothetical protein
MVFRLSQDEVAIVGSSLITYPTVPTSLNGVFGLKHG